MLYPLSYEGLGRDPSRSNCGYWRGGRVRGAGRSHPSRGLPCRGVTEPDFVQTTRASYDALAVEYAEYVRDELMAQPWERAVLSVFAELVRADRAGSVADVGCGEGRVTAHLRDLGL